MVSGMATGVVGITVANPTDVCKVRMQVQGMKGSPIQYSSTFDLYRKVAKTEG